MRQMHVPDRDLLLLEEDALPFWARLRARRHLAGCVACGERRRELAAGVAALRHLHGAAEDAGGGLRDRLMAGLMAGMMAEDHPRSGVIMRYAPFAVALLLVAAGGVYGGRLLGRVARGPDRQDVAALPIRGFTPGVVREAKVAELCAGSDPDNDRTIDQRTEQQIFHEYGVPLSDRGVYQVDYLISPGLGGADDIKNLWPEPSGSTEWTAQVKDRLETHLHAMVCAGQLPLDAAQEQLANDWIAAYKRYFKTERPEQTRAELDGAYGLTAMPRANLRYH